MTNLTDLIDAKARQNNIAINYDYDKNHRAKKGNRVAFVRTLVMLYKVVRNENNECWQEFNIYRHGTANEIRIYMRQFRERL